MKGPIEIRRRNSTFWRSALGNTRIRESSLWISQPKRPVRSREHYDRCPRALYEVSTEQLVDRDATRSLWKIYARSGPRTTLPDRRHLTTWSSCTLCGHGLRDRRTNRWYFVTADANFSDLMDDRYGDCLSFRRPCPARRSSLPQTRHHRLLSQWCRPARDARRRLEERPPVAATGLGDHFDRQRRRRRGSGVARIRLGPFHDATSGSSQRRSPTKTPTASSS